MPKERHIVSLSGGKDSTALAIFLQKNFPHLAYEFVFCDTGEELPETYSYLEKIETYLGKKIVRLRAERTWDQFLEDFSGYLPSARSRWCTANMKIKPFERRHDQYETRVKRDKQKKSKRLIDVFSSELSFEDALNMEDDAEGCLVCHV
jgi:3'-phosphoadenosine 5'-phosphosulfate sulfotransferase (PAPS reductase)/FAD synthetase